MKLLLINGSPKGQRSNSLRLAEAFIKGLSDNTDGGVETERVAVRDLELSPCRGCFCCWHSTPGQCVIHDDMAGVIEKMLWADIIVFSFPLYYYGVPGQLKILIDRQLPMVLPFMAEREDGVGSGSHPMRYDMSGKRWVLISTCGFYSAKGNYDGVRAMFDHICGKDRYESIFCGQGELFSVKELHGRTEEYAQLVERAGAEYAAGGIKDETRRRLDENLLPKETFEAMADASWGISRESGEKEEKSLVFTRQMAALYNKNSYDGKDRVLEMCYTDLGRTYQILLGKDGSEVRTDGSLAATTRIETPWDVWLAVARGEKRGDAALAEGLYRVKGDFSLMLNWDTIFGEPEENGEEKKKTAAPTKEKKPPVMLLMLAAWICLWVALSVNPHIGPFITIAVCAALPLLFAGHELCVYDRISLAAAALLAVFAAISGLTALAVQLGYLGFGLLWLGSCLTKEPLCAAYVKYGYGGDDALENPIFMKTNVILAVCWGVLYVLLGAASLIFALSGGTFVLLSQLAPLLMGAFTVWFEKWYPARVARG